MTEVFKKDMVSIESISTEAPKEGAKAKNEVALNILYSSGRSNKFQKQR